MQLKKIVVSIVQSNKEEMIGYVESRHDLMCKSILSAISEYNQQSQSYSANKSTVKEDNTKCARDSDGTSKFPSPPSQDCNLGENTHFILFSSCHKFSLFYVLFFIYYFFCFLKATKAIL